MTLYFVLSPENVAARFRFDNEFYGSIYFADRMVYRLPANLKTGSWSAGAYSFIHAEVCRI